MERNITLLFFLLLIILVVYLVIYNKKHPAQYDERQKIVRGQAFMHGFFAVMIFEAINYFSCTVLDASILAPGASSIISICIGLFVYAEESILRDAFIQIGKTPDAMIGLLLLNGINMALMGRSNLKLQDFLPDAPLPCNIVAPFALASCFIILAVTMLIKMFCNKSEDDA